MHEPRLIKVIQVLINEPEHPTEEHERDQFSQSVNHGRYYIIILRPPCGDNAKDAYTCKKHKTPAIAEVCVSEDLNR